MRPASPNAHHSPAKERVAGRQGGRWRRDERGARREQGAGSREQGERPKQQAELSPPSPVSLSRPLQPLSPFRGGFTDLAAEMASHVWLAKEIRSIVRKYPQ